MGACLWVQALSSAASVLFLKVFNCNKPASDANNMMAGNAKLMLFLCIAYEQYQQATSR